MTVYPLDFMIPGQPVTGGTTRVSVAKGRPMFFKPRGYAQSIKWIQSHVREQLPDGFVAFKDTPLAIEVVFVSRKPKSWPKRENVPWKKPDAENLFKPIGDALGSKRYGHLVYDDDARLVSIRLSKVFGDDEQTIISIWPVDRTTGEKEE